VFLADLARRILLLFVLLIFLVPLSSLMSSGGHLSAAQLTETAVLIFIAGSLARSILDGRLFIDSRMARPATALAALVAAAGLCSAFEQTADASVAIARSWRSATSYFVGPDAGYFLQPTLQWLEFCALVPFVELSVRRRPEWRDVTVMAWLGACAVAAAGAAVALWPADGASAGANGRIEMVMLALETARQVPVFGVGPGGFVWASSTNLEPSYFLPLVVLVEYGCLGLAVFGGLLWTALRPLFVDKPTRTARTAVVGGLVAFLLSAFFAPPLLEYPIAAATFVTLGFAAGMLPPRAASTARPLRWIERIVLAMLLIPLPWRITQALSPGTPEVAGAGPVQPELEGVGYRIAEPVSRWRVQPRSRMFVALMRWDPPAAEHCRVRIVVRDRPPDEVSLRSDVWIPVRLSIPPGRPNDAPEVEFHVSSPACRLLVGTVTATK
jgi:hypothetical protein